MFSSLPFLARQYISYLALRGKKKKVLTLDLEQAKTNSKTKQKQCLPLGSLHCLTGGKSYTEK